MKFALILATLTLAAPLAHAKDVPTPRIGWVDSAKLNVGSTEIARLRSHIAGKTVEQAQEILAQGNGEIDAHERAACAKVKADKHLSMVVRDPLAADPADEVTAEVLKLWNAADEAGVAQENARLTARVAQLEAEKLTKPAPPTVPPAPPIQPAHVAKK